MTCDIQYFGHYYEEPVGSRSSNEARSVINFMSIYSYQQVAGTPNPNSLQVRCQGKKFRVLCVSIKLDNMHWQKDNPSIWFQWMLIDFWQGVEKMEDNRDSEDFCDMLNSTTIPRLMADTIITGQRAILKTWFIWFSLMRYSIYR